MRRRGPLRLIRPVAITLFLAMLAVVSVLPEPLKKLTSTHGLLHDGLHIAAFLAALLIAAGPSKSSNTLVLWAIVLMCFGTLLELVQTRIYNNPLEVRDILDDAVGIGAGVWLLVVMRGAVPHRPPARSR